MIKILTEPVAIRKRIQSRNDGGADGGEDDRQALRFTNLNPNPGVTTPGLPRGEQMPMKSASSSRTNAASAIVLLLAWAAPGGPVALANPTAGVDSAMFRSSYDTGGIFSLEGARLMPKRDISWKMLLSYAKSPLNVAVPGIGGTEADSVLDYVAIVDMAFGMSISDRFAIGMDVAAYRTATASGYGKRGLYNANPTLVGPSTGVVALRPLSNIDPSGGLLKDGLAGPLDVRLAGKLALVRGERMALSFIGTMTLPFGEEEMLLGDASLTFEPKLAIDFRLDRVRATKLVLNLGARLRKRTALQSFDPGAMETSANAKVFLDVGSEATAGAGFLFEVTPRIVVGAEANAFVPLPASFSIGKCRINSGRQCSDLTDADYFGDAKSGDLTVLANAACSCASTNR
jgi:hypothetical protein